MALRLKKRGDKALERALVVASPDLDGDERDAAGTAGTGAVGKGKWKGHPEEDTIEEGEEPPSTAGLHGPGSRRHSHRREVAETGGSTG